MGSIKGIVKMLKIGKPAAKVLLIEKEKRSETIWETMVTH